MDDCLIIGGGVVGLSIAYELSLHGLQVHVIDQGSIGREASWAGAGILPPANANTAIHPLEQLRAVSHQLHEEWASRLRAETGIDTGFRKCGGIYLARTAGEYASLVGFEQDLQAQQIDGRRLARDELLAKEPGLKQVADSGTLRAALLLPDEAQLRNPMHLKALDAACRARGVKVTAECAAIDFVVRSGRVDAVDTTGGKLSAMRVCIAGGAWSHQLLQQLGIATGIMPVRGQMVLYRCNGQPVRHVVNEGPRYIVPRDDGYVLVGSTEEEVGFDKSTTVDGIRELQDLAQQLVPELCRDNVVRSWAGLRPGSFDAFPYLGKLPGLENAFVAAGHFRSGLHMSTGTAVVMSQLIRDKSPQIDLSPFNPGRG